MKWFCIHDWSQWSGIVNTYTTPYQYRYCNKCNLIKKKRVAFTTSEVNLSEWNHKPEDSQQGEG